MTLQCIHHGHLIGYLTKGSLKYSPPPELFVQTLDRKPSWWSRSDPNRVIVTTR